MNLTNITLYSSLGQQDIDTDTNLSSTNWNEIFYFFKAIDGCQININNFSITNDELRHIKAFELSNTILNLTNFLAVNCTDTIFDLINT